MKLLLICSFIISPLWLWAQQDSLQKVEKPGILVGVDIFNPVLSVFSEKKGAEAMVSVPIKKKWHAVAEVGFEKNQFENSVWDVDVKGVYARLGANWFISNDIKNPNMGYYLGGRFAFSPYQETVNKYLIQGTDVDNLQGSIPQHNASTFWMEPIAGGRVQIAKTNFYVDASVKLKIKLFDSNAYDLTPLVIPGFGTNENGLNFGVNWSLAYVIPLHRKQLK